MPRHVRSALVAGLLAVGTVPAAAYDQLCLLGANAAAPDGAPLMVLGTAAAGLPRASSGQTLCTPRVVQVRTSLNVRTGPGLEYERLGSLGPGARVCVVAEQDGWCLIVRGGGFAWVCARYVRPPSTTGAAPQAAPQAASGPAPADVAATGRSLDKLFSRYPGSTMYGQGNRTVELSRRYGVPLDLALGILGKESTFCSRGRSVRWNNPGNLRDRSGRYGAITGTEDGYAKYVDVATGLEAFFKLLSRRDGPYWRHVQSGDYAALYRVYAPASDGNDVAEYRRETEGIRRMVRRELGA